MPQQKKPTRVSPPVDPAEILARFQKNLKGESTLEGKLESKGIDFSQAQKPLRKRPFQPMMLAGNSGRPVSPVELTDEQAFPTNPMSQIGLGSIPQAAMTMAVSPGGTASQNPDDFKGLLKILADSFVRDKGMHGDDAALRAALTTDSEAAIDQAASQFLSKRSNDFSASERARMRPSQPDSSSLMDDLGFDYSGPEHLRPKGPTSEPGSNAGADFLGNTVTDALKNRGATLGPGSVVPPSLRGKSPEFIGGLGKIGGNDPLMQLIDELASQWLRKGVK